MHLRLSFRLRRLRFARPWIYLASTTNTVRLVTRQRPGVFIGICIFVDSEHPFSIFYVTYGPNTPGLEQHHY